MTWYQKGAAAGSPDAMYNIGFAYYSGQGVAKDYQQAMAWYLKSANAGFPLAMEQIAYLYTDGLGVAANRNLGLTWYRLAASAGDAPSQQWLKQNGLL